MLMVSLYWRIKVRIYKIQIKQQTTGQSPETTDSALFCPVTLWYTLPKYAYEEVKK